MTSKEALEMIVVDLVPKAKENNKEEIELIKRDLEVLELLKTRQVELKLIKASKDYKHYLNLICSYNVFTDLTEQEYNLIKEWLNEKQ